MDRKDLVCKLSKLASSGRHLQNAERDLQRTINKFGKSLKIQIDSVPVRLYNPATEDIEQGNLSVLCPISVATALWHEGQDVFADTFLGPAGASGAELFWRNAKKNASWFKANLIPESQYGGLLPLYVYGDDVEAYRNSEQGAVSVIGWGVRLLVQEFGHATDLSCWSLCGLHCLPVYA